MMMIKQHTLELIDEEKDIYKCTNCGRQGSSFLDFNDNCNGTSNDDEEKTDIPKSPFGGFLDFFKPTQL